MKSFKQKLDFISFTGLFFFSSIVTNNNRIHKRYTHHIKVHIKVIMYSQQHFSLILIKRAVKMQEEMLCSIGKFWILDSSNVQIPCSLSNTWFYLGFLLLLFWFHFPFWLFQFHLWNKNWKSFKKLKKQAKLLDGWCLSTMWYNTYILFFLIGPKVTGTQVTEQLASLPGMNT